MGAGEGLGIEPMGSAALEHVCASKQVSWRQVPSFAAGVDAFEAGLGFAVDLRKSDFVGKDRHFERNAGSRNVSVLKGLDPGDR